jgi:hypothetical protein
MKNKEQIEAKIIELSSDLKRFKNMNDEELVRQCTDLITALKWVLNE